MTSPRIARERAGNGGTVDVILPVLDEEEGLRWVLPRFPEGFRPVVVDNGSTDASAEVARTFGAQVVEEPVRGFGAACFAGLCAADSPVVAFMDADASLDPRQLPEVVEPVTAGRADLVLGSRRADPGAWPATARLANRVLCWELRRRGAPTLVDLGPMRAGRRTDLLSLHLSDRRFGWPLEMVVRGAQSGWRIAEVEVRYRPRLGRSKVTGTVKGTLRATRDMIGVLR